RCDRSNPHLPQFLPRAGPKRGRERFEPGGCPPQHLKTETRMPVTLYQPMMFGDTNGSIGGMRHGLGQNISTHMPGISDTQTIVGDADTLLLRAVGGNDNLTSFAYGGSTVIGDAITITGGARGGNDQILATSMTNSAALGDAMTLNSHAQGG